MNPPLTPAPDRLAERLGSISFASDAAAEEWNPEAPTPRLYVGVTVPRRRILIFAAVVMAGFALYFGRAFFLQVGIGSRYRALAEGNRLRVIREPAARGIIFDRDGAPLVKNIPNFGIALTGADLPRDAAELDRIKSLLLRYGVSDDEWLSAVRSARATPFETTALSVRLAYEPAMLFATEAAGVNGVALVTMTGRVYLPDGGRSDSLAHILGYQGRISAEEFSELRAAGYSRNDLIGKTGVEAALEKELRGQVGERRIEVDALGRERRVVSATMPAIGRNVRLTIDRAAQAALERILRDSLRRSGRRRAAAVALDPRDGSVIAVVSLPAYDPNLFTRPVSAADYATLSADPDQPLFDRAISGQYPSGSTIKPVVAVAALAEKIITENTTIVSRGGLWYQKRWFFPDWKAGGHGVTDVIKALAESVNTFFYTIGGGTETFNGLGPERLAEYARRFGLGRKLGIELPGEGSGLLPTPAWKKATKGEDWYIGDTYHLSIGQGDLLVTPLQVAAMTAVISNGGTLWRPHLVAAVYDPSAERWTETAPEKLADNTALAPEVAVVRRGMRAAVVSGSARALASVVVPAAGKTGTAQWSASRPPQAWFTGYAPADHPSLVLTVLVEEGGEGSSTAVPVARDFFNWYFALGRQQPK